MYSGVPSTIPVWVRFFRPAWNSPASLAMPKSTSFADGGRPRLDEHVVRLDVAVDDPLVVGRRQRLGDAAGVRRGLAGRAVARHAISMASQGLAPQELHHDVGAAVVLSTSQSKICTMPAVPDQRRRSGLGEEPLQQVRAGDELL